MKFCKLVVMKTNGGINYVFFLISEVSDLIALKTYMKKNKKVQTEILKK